MGTLSGGLGSFPLDYEAHPPQSDSRDLFPAFGVWIGLVPALGPHRLSALPPTTVLSRGSPSSDFGENQLSPGSFGISPLPTVHPNPLQRKPVRASTRRYSRFTLTMGSSPGFGSTPRDLSPSSDLLSLRLGVLLSWPCHVDVTRWVILQKARHGRFLDSDGL